MGGTGDVRYSVASYNGELVQPSNIIVIGNRKLLTNCFSFSEIKRNFALAPHTDRISDTNHRARWLRRPRECCELGRHPSQRHFNNQLNAQFLYSITICMLHYNPRHVSSINMPLFRRTKCIITASGIVTLCKRLYRMPDESSLQRNCALSWLLK